MGRKKLNKVKIIDFFNLSNGSLMVNIKSSIKPTMGGYLLNSIEEPKFRIIGIPFNNLKMIELYEKKNISSVELEKLTDEDIHIEGIYFLESSPRSR